MPQLKKSLKIKIALTIIWGVLTALFSGMIAQDYSSFNFGTFLGALVFLNFPTLLYWLGVWIWGDGYLFRFFAWPFKFVARPIRIFLVSSAIIAIFGFMFLNHLEKQADQREIDNLMRALGYKVKQ